MPGASDHIAPFNSDGKRARNRLRMAGVAPPFRWMGRRRHRFSVIRPMAGVRFAVLGVGSR